MTAPVLIASTAHAEFPSENDRSFAAVERLLDSADFEGAEEADTRLLHSGVLSRREVARAHLELGIIRGARGRMADAELDFLRALVLDSDAALPATVGPEVTDAFVRAQRRLATEPPFKVRVEFDRTDRAAGVIVRSFLRGARVGLVERLDVQGAGPSQTVALDENAPTTIYRVPAADSVCRPLLVRLEDRYGNELWRFQEDPSACQERQASPTGVVQSRSPRSQTGSSTPRHSLPTQVWVGAVISANFLIATSVIGIAALNARADYHHIVHDPEVSISRKQSEHDHASRLQDLATAAGVGAVASLGVTALLYVTQQKTGSRGSAAARSVNVDVGPQGALAGVRLEF